jgi:hypothetical protein
MSNNKEKGILIGGILAGFLISGTAIASSPSSSNEFFKFNEIPSGYQSVMNEEGGEKTCKGDKSCKGEKDCKGEKSCKGDKGCAESGCS